MQTKSGKKITNLTVVGDSYAGIVDGKILTWDVNGRRSKKNKSKLDMDMKQSQPTVFYLNINEWNGKKHIDQKKFKNEKDAIRNAKLGYIKTIRVEI